MFHIITVKCRRLELQILKCNLIAELYITTKLNYIHECVDNNNIYSQSVVLNLSHCEYSKPQCFIHFTFYYTRWLKAV